MPQAQLIKLTCKDCKRINYWSRKNKKKLADVKLDLQKFCRFCRKRTTHKESKK